LPGLVTPEALPALVIFPLASGAPAVGLTCIFENAAWHVVVTPIPSWAVTVKVIVLDVGVAVNDEKVKQVLLPAILVIAAVTVAPVLNWNHEGALKTIVPRPTSLFAPSTIEGPFNAVYAPFTVSEEIVDPPPATVMNMEK
jgi:hypothetical protein